MSVLEMKKEINEKVEKLNDEKALQQILNLLNAEKQADKPIDVTKYKDKLFSENDGLLKRLA